MALKELIVNDSILYHIRLLKASNYQDDILCLDYLNNWYLKKDDRKINKIYYNRYDYKNVLFIEFKERRVLEGYYIKGLELI